MTDRATDVLVIGAGVIGVATAYYLKEKAPALGVTLVDGGDPLALTSARSGENYRNWWPHPVMRDLTNRSIDLMEEIARQPGSALNMTRRGYVLATRTAAIGGILDELLAGYAGEPGSAIRVHEPGAADTYAPPIESDWRRAPDGVDVLHGRPLIEHHFPWFDPAVQTIVHVRRGGSIDSQQMGRFMLDRFRERGGRRLRAKVVAIEKARDFTVALEPNGGPLRAGRIVNAAGPFLDRVAGMLGVRLPVRNVLQQKISFEDGAGAIPRRMPFSIDLDGQELDWTAEERALIADDPERGWLARPMPGAIHCRPDGGDRGNRIKLGWAFNRAPSPACREPRLNDDFPEIVLRGAARLNPALKAYYGRLPRALSHYGGFYTMTDENWPLIGPLGVDGAFVVGAMSGFGTMAACAAGELSAQWLLGDARPAYAAALAPARYEDAALMAGLRAHADKGVL